MKTTFQPKLGGEVSRFGLGCMRLPTVNGKPDHEEGVRMIRYAIDHGVNYVDTAYMYLGGESEVIVGKALKDGYRERTNLATKLPIGMCHDASDFQRIFDEQMSRLQVDCLDNYLLHGINANSWKNVCLKFDVLSFMEKLKAQGKIKNVCFSFHDSLDTFKEVIDAYPFAYAQIQLNYMDVKHQAGLEGLAYAREKGTRTVIMEPLRGGALANVPEEIAAILNSGDEGFSPVEWAFRFLIDNPNVDVVLSGSSSMEQLQDTIRIFSSAEAGCMTDAQREILAKAKAAYDARTAIGCTGCRYCMPCPQGVNIPGIFSTWNNAAIFGNYDNGRRQYERMVSRGEGQDNCVGCGACEAACPQQLSIIESLKTAAEQLS